MNFRTDETPMNFEQKPTSTPTRDIGSTVVSKFRSKGFPVNNAWNTADEVLTCALPETYVYAI